ncbi:three-Cys-motif partner protein TcmP [Pararhodobacter marinus]|uniref:three-Cys-motif partner protein TcmP n=1 Tax=Pararhodobacter marinus TaxID=2184063 RepID=UPI0035113D97
MGRAPGKKGVLKGQIELFDSEDLGTRKAEPSFRLTGGNVPQTGILKPPDQTNAKSKLIAEYIRLFQQVTRGGLYIDGFAAPQSRSHEESWTARRVLEIEPKRLRGFWLCDIEEGGYKQLEKLRAQHHRVPRSRRVRALKGDFNDLVKGILKTPTMRRNTAVFALLDQRTAECHWDTVRAIAAREGRTKIEILYFIGTGWLHRSLTQSKTPKRLLELQKWWGSDEWSSLTQLTQLEMVTRIAARFTDELNYKFVKSYPITQEERGNKVAFHLVHASDHPEAPKLMDRAFLKICKDAPGFDDGRQSEMFSSGRSNPAL